MNEPFKPGAQIAYLPRHAEGNIQHPDVEFGFVTAYVPEVRSYFCRYWRKGKIGVELRTHANSEMTYAHMVVAHESVPQEVVEQQIVQIYGAPEV